MKKLLLSAVFCFCVMTIGLAQNQQCKLHSKFVGVFNYINIYVGGNSPRFVESIPVASNGSFVFKLPRVYSNDMEPVSSAFGGLSISNPNTQVAMLNIDGTLYTGENHSEYMGPSYNCKRSSGVIMYIYANSNCSVSGNNGGINVSLNFRQGWNTVKVQGNSMTTVSGNQGWNWGTD